MSEANKTRYEIQKILSDAVKDGLTKYIGASHGFGVMEFAQASFQKANKIVLLNPVRTRRVGWQSSTYPVISDALKRKEEWIEEQAWQFHVILKKGDSPVITDMQADDVAQLLIAYFNGVGCDYLRTKGVAPLRVADESIIVYNDDSELYQKRAVFTMKLQVPKELSISQDDMTAVSQYDIPNDPDHQGIFAV